MTKYKLGADVDLDEEVVKDSKGRRITERRADQLAAEALGKVGRGRPSLARGVSPQVSFRTPENLRELASKRAKEQGTTVSALARQAFVAFLTTPATGASSGTGQKRAAKAKAASTRAKDAAKGRTASAKSSASPRDGTKGSATAKSSSRSGGQRRAG